MTTPIADKPLHPNAGMLLRQIFDFSDITRAVFHTAVSDKSSPTLSLLLTLMGVGMRSPANVVLPQGVPLSLMVAIFNRDGGPTVNVTSAIRNSKLDEFGHMTLNPGSTHVIDGCVSRHQEDDTSVWVHAFQPVSAIVHGHGFLHQIWAEGLGNPPRSHYVTYECYGALLRQFMDIDKGQLSDLFLMSFPTLGCRPEEAYVPLPSPWFSPPPIPSPENGVALCPQALSALKTGMTETWNPALVNRVKLAALGALLHGDDYVGEGIWRWAGMVLTHCDRSRNVAKWVLRRQLEQDAPYL